MTIKRTKSPLTPTIPESSSLVTFPLANLSEDTSVTLIMFLIMDSTTTCWDCWPRPVRLLILQALLADGCSLAELATVSREWQKVVEQHNFTRIKVTPPRLTNFSSIIRRNRSLVNYI